MPKHIVVPVRVTVTVDVIGVFGTDLHRTSMPTAACQSPKFTAANISVRPAVAN